MNSIFNMKNLNKRQIKNLRDIIVSLCFFIVLEIIEHFNIFSILDHKMLLFILYLIPYFIAGHHVIRKSLLSIKNRQPFNESFLMTLATIGAFITGEFGEAAAVMLFYMTGEWFQDYAVNKSRNSITELMDIAPEYANVEMDGKIIVEDPEDVPLGSVIVIKPGEKVPLDGIIIEGDSMINTSALTGESVPRHMTYGEEIISGCINGDGLLKAKTTRLYNDSTVAKILELVENAADKKSKTEAFITKFARYYTPAVVIGALLLAIIPSLITRDFMTWMYRACTFLVISCPCALVISIPLAFFGGIGAAGRNGILVKGSNYLEIINDTDMIISDKTGTLTKGVFKVIDVISDKDKNEVLKLAALAENMSTHPIAQSIKKAYHQDLDLSLVSHIENISGKGISGIIDGQVIHIGNASFMKDNHIAFSEINKPGASVVYLSSDNNYLGAIIISDEVKDEAKQSLDSLKKEGIKRFVMLTGDQYTSAEAVAKKLGIDEYYSELMPQDKVEKIEELFYNQTHKTAFIGDGINDAPVLTRCDVGIAMGSMGSDAAIEAADIVIMDDDLRKLPLLKRIAKKTIHISSVNIIFALAVKVLTLLFGALGIADMWWAVFADVGVAFICILNSMRTLRVQ